MYYPLTEPFLKCQKKEIARWIASFIEPTALVSIPHLVKCIENKFNRDSAKTRKSYFLFCEFCRQTGVLSVGMPKKPFICVFCGEASPIDSFNINISRAEKLLALASKLEVDQETKSLLLEQAIVIIVTSLEILFRKTYAVIMDCKHVTYGQSILNSIYNDTRNEFLNFGVTNSKFKRDVGINLKSSIGETNFKLFSSIYSKRHVVIHNASIIDSEYINQTGCDENLLKKRVPLTIPEVKHLISNLNILVNLISPVLNASIINLIENMILINPAMNSFRNKEEQNPALMGKK
jgi:hypothetical protein